MACERATGPAAPAAHYLYVVRESRRLPSGAGCRSADRDAADRSLHGCAGSGRRRSRRGPGGRCLGALDALPGGRWFALAGSQLGLLRLASSGAVERVGTPDGGGLSSAFDTQGRYFFLTTGRGLEVHGFGLRRGPDIGKPLHLEAGVLPLSLATSPDGALLYAVAEQRLLVYAIGEQGRLTAAGGSPVALDLRGLELAVHPSGRFLLVLGEVKSDCRVAVLSVSGSGAVEPVAGLPFDIGQRVRGMALSRDGARLFITDEDRHSIETFALDAGGGLHRVASTPTGPKGVGTLVVDASDRFLYAGTVSGVLAWGIEASGELTPVPGAPFALDGKPGDIVTTPRLEGPLQAAALPEASSFDAEPERVDSAHPIAADTDLARILELLEDRSHQTRYTAILALHRVTDLAPAVPALVKALDDQATGISLRARLMLGPWALQHPGTVDDEVLDSAREREERPRHGPGQRQPLRPPRAHRARARRLTVSRADTGALRPAPRRGAGRLDQHGPGREARGARADAAVARRPRQPLRRHGVGRHRSGRGGGDAGALRLDAGPIPVGRQRRAPRHRADPRPRLSAAPVPRV